MHSERDLQPWAVESDKPKHECGVFGIYAPGEDVSRLTFYGIFALQHRGQESAGIAASDGREIKDRKHMGPVFNLIEEDIAALKGKIAIGHTRYSNTGGSTLANAQPVTFGQIAIAENGNLVNPQDLRRKLAQIGIFPTIHSNGESCSSDGELIAQTIATSPGKNWLEKIQNASRNLIGAYSLTIIAGDTLYGVKDPYGVWPLCLGTINDRGYVLASESCALDTIGAKLVRELEPGEIIAINDDGLKSFYLPARVESQSAACAFDANYFQRPDSIFRNGDRIRKIRMRLGRQLAIDHPVDADIVISIPRSGDFGAMGFSKQSGIPLEVGFIKNEYIGRTFIMPDQRIRDLGVRLKLNPFPEVISGQRIVVVDDSIVRGTTSPLITEILFLCGAQEVHMRLTFPPVKHPCFIGVDIPTRNELVASERTVEQIRQKIGATSVGYNSIENFFKYGLMLPKEHFCTGCLTGDHPITVPPERDKFALERYPIRVV